MMSLGIPPFCRSLLAGDIGCGSELARDFVIIASKLAPTKAPASLFALITGLVLFPGCQTTRPAESPPLVARFYLEIRPGDAGVPVRLPVSGVSVTVGAKPVFSEYDIVDAAVAQTELGACLRLDFTPAAARDLYRLSAASLGRRLVLLLNEEPLGARRIEQTIPDGAILVFVETSDAELPGLVERLKRTTAGIVAAGKKGR